MKLHLGCGKNHLEGWINKDKEIDITKPLPWGAYTADFIFLEHVIEHVTSAEAIFFFNQAYRVLKPGGVLRISFPDIERVTCLSLREFEKYSKTRNETIGSCILSIAKDWGHKTIWTMTSMSLILKSIGFSTITFPEYGKSEILELMGIDSHHKISQGTELETSVVQGYKL